MDKLDTGSKEAKAIELTRGELETVVGGGKSSGGNTSGHTYLVFNFKLVAVKTVSWSY
jgi:hypothetical protein